MRFGVGSVSVLCLCVAGCNGNVALGGPQGGNNGAPSDASTQGVADSAPATDAPLGSSFDAADPCSQIEQLSLAIRQRSCAQCHGPSGPQIDFDFVLDDNALATRPVGLIGPLVIPRDPTDSDFYKRMVEGLYFTDPAFAGTPMAAPNSFGMPPPPGARQIAGSTAAQDSIVSPTSEDLSVIYTWILICVPRSDGGVASADDSGPSSALDATPTTGPQPDATAPRDGATTILPPFDAGQAPAGLAGIAFVVNGQVQTPLSCPAENWAFPPPAPQVPVGDAGGRDPANCVPDGISLCPGVTSALLVNTGAFPVAYTAQSRWTGSNYPPGVDFGDPNELSGVLAPGEQVDITAVYEGGITAVVGSAAPFSSPDAGKYAADESTIPWPAGVAGSQGATQMQVAQIDVASACGHINPVY